MKLEELGLLDLSAIEEELSKPLPVIWGPWKLNKRILTLTFSKRRHPANLGPPYYEIDLERILDSASMLDWIMQITGKTWADDFTIASLVRALNEIFQPQHYLCSFGILGNGTAHYPKNYLKERLGPRAPKR